MKKACIITLLSLTLLNFNTLARDHVIYSIAQEIPMGEDNEVIKKNYYLNIGENQGVKIGTKLDVYRVISNVNPYNDKERVNHKVKIGELEVLHSDSDASIASMKNTQLDSKKPLFELNDFMIGDHVDVSIK
ncbi:MAG: hypothetical protein N4A33_09860 [Bacteriovoracaceae bacterium]|jgi:hypothetical protein|nr:hypothetical protein [Bacteriovoracaceae bacterium]